MVPGGVASLSALLPSPGAWRPLKSLFRATGSGYRRTTHGKLYQGAGQPVIVMPVLGSGPDSTAELRGLLDDAGFVSYDWGMGVDTGPGGTDLKRWLRALEEKVIDVFETERATVTLMGWGLSGIYAREVSKRTNPLVRQVITLGSPFNTASDPDHRCTMLQLLGGGQGSAVLNLRHRLQQCPPVPFTSLYSKTDTIAPWELCLENETPRSENIEIPGAGHLDLASHPYALEVITHRLAQREGTWRPFDA